MDLRLHIFFCDWSHQDNRHGVVSEEPSETLESLITPLNSLTKLWQLSPILWRQMIKSITVQYSDHSPELQFNVLIFLSALMNTPFLISDIPLVNELSNIWR